MDSFKNIIVTEIEPPIVVHSETGRRLQMTNRECYGLSLCYGGQITYRMNGKTFVSKNDTAVVLPQGATYTLSGDKDGLFPVINFYSRDFLCNQITVIPLNNPQACLNLFETIKNQYYSSGNYLKTFGYLYMLFDEIFSENVKTPSALVSAIKYIDEKLSCPDLSNTDVANHLKISEVYLRKLFTKHLNKTPKQYILHHRFEKSKSLLTESNLKMTAIAEKCGFGSVYHFCRAFKQRTGLTPTQYAINNRIFKI